MLKRLYLIKLLGASRETENKKEKHPAEKKLNYGEVHVWPSADRLYCTGASRPDKNKSRTAEWKAKWKPACGEQ